jgi:hypothetical protein
MLTLILCAALGIALTYVIPTGVKPGTKYHKPTEAEFEALLIRRGLK